MNLIKHQLQSDSNHKLKARKQRRHSDNTTASTSQYTNRKHLIKTVMYKAKLNTLGHWFNWFQGACCFQGLS